MHVLLNKDGIVQYCISDMKKCHNCLYKYDLIFDILLLKSKQKVNLLLKTNM